MAVISKRPTRRRKKEAKKVSYTTKTGYFVERTVGEREAPFTKPELINQQGTRLVTEFLKSLNPVIRIGYQNVPEGKHWTAYNHASSVLKLTAVKGTYPNKEIDFEKVRLSVGNLAQPKNVKVELADKQLTFSWDANMEAVAADINDRIMVVVYFPETKQSLYVINGAKRTEEREVLPLPDLPENTVIQTYIAFINRDSTECSDSVYSGQFSYVQKSEIANKVIGLGEGQQKLVKELKDLPKVKKSGRPRNDVRRRRKVRIPEHNLRLKLIQNAQRWFAEAINKGFASRNWKGTARGRAIRYNLQHAIKGQYPDLELDYSQLKFSLGSREGVWGAKLTFEENAWVRLDWQIPEICNMKVIGDDKAYVIVYHETTHNGNDISIERFQSIRSALSHRVHIPRAKKDDVEYVHVWMFFESPDGKERSDSYYFGSGYVK
jgi:hypothetical protein